MDKEIIKNILKNIHLYKLAKKVSEYKHGIIERIRNKKLKKNGLKAMIKTRNTLNRLGIVFWLEFGTLLGAVRDSNFIKGDTDIDLGIFMEDRPNDFEKILLGEGFEKKYHFILGDKIIEERYCYGGVGIDFSYFERKNSKIYTHVFFKNSKKTKNNKELFDVVKYTYDKFDKVKEFKFKGELFYIPENAEILLEQKYGKNWKIPEDNWDFLRAPNAEIIEQIGRIIKIKKRKTYKQNAS